MNPTVAIGIIERWDPASEDLPDEIALLLDQDEAVLAAFNARFAPVSQLAAVPEALDQTLAEPIDASGNPPAEITARSPRRSKAVPLAALGLLMAAGLSMVVLTTATLGSPQFAMVAAEPPSGDPQSEIESEISAQGAQKEIDALRSLGYLGYVNTDNSKSSTGQTQAPVKKRSVRKAVVRTPNAARPMDVGEEGDRSPVIIRGRVAGKDGEGRDAERSEIDGRWRDVGGEDTGSSGPVAGLLGDLKSQDFGNTVDADGDFRSLNKESQQGRVAHAGQGQQVVVTSSSIEIAEKLQFDSGQTAVNGVSKPMLDEMAQVLNDNPAIGNVAIEGHTGSQGASSYNQRLSQERANEVRQGLIDRGVDANRLHAVGFGEDKPISSNATNEGRARNSRVELRIMEPDEAVPLGAVAVVPIPAPEPKTEDYTDYGHHDFELTNSDNQSTFAVDVDTASYTIVRRKLRQGYLPPTSAVRVEEFVNYFPYEYRPPSNDPFAVHFEGSANPWNKRTQMVRVGIQGKRVGSQQRKPVHLTFLVDTSGSMDTEDKLGLVKKTLIMLTEELEDGDTVAIVAYAGSAGLVLPPTPMSQKSTIIRSLSRMSAGGSTAMGAGIDLAYQQAQQSYRDGAVNRVLIVSDGDANVGAVHHTALSSLIREHAQAGITLTTVGFGQGNYKDTTMERLANDGDGNYFYIDSEAEARRVFVDQLTSTMEVIAKDVKLQVEWNPEDVVAYRLIGYENRDIADRDFRNDKVDAGEIGSGHSVTALYEVALTDDASGRIGTVHVRNKAPGPDSPAVERSYALHIDSLGRDFGETTRGYRLSVAAASFAELLRDSPHMHEYGYRDVLAIARGAQRVEYDEDGELVELIGLAARLAGE